MRTLVIDTATKACSVALFDDDTLIESHYETIGRGHAERLLPFIADFPGRGKADQIMVNVGPGSFTGIRVGIAASRALGLAWDVHVSGYGCLGLVAAMARAQTKSSDAVDVAMTGGHGEYFFERFDGNGASLDHFAALAPENAARRSTAALIAGDAAADLVKERGSGVSFDILPDAAQWHLVAAVAALPATPIYGRPPDAKPGKGMSA